MTRKEKEMLLEHIANHIYVYYFGRLGYERSFRESKIREILAWLEEGDEKTLDKTLDQFLVEWGKIESQSWEKLAAQVATIPELRAALEGLLVKYCDLVHSEWNKWPDRDECVIAARTALGMEATL